MEQANSKVVDDRIEGEVAVRVPEHVVGGELGPWRHGVVLNLAPGDGILGARGAVVNSDLVGRFDGPVAGGNDHQIDWKLDGNDVAHHVSIHLESPEEAFAHAGD